MLSRPAPLGLSPAAHALIPSQPWRKGGKLRIENDRRALDASARLARYERRATVKAARG